MTLFVADYTRLHQLRFLKARRWLRSSFHTDLQLEGLGYSQEACTGLLGRGYDRAPLECGCGALFVLPSGSSTFGLCDLPRSAPDNHEKRQEKRRYGVPCVFIAARMIDDGHNCQKREQGCSQPNHHIRLPKVDRHQQTQRSGNLQCGKCGGQPIRHPNAATAQRGLKRSSLTSADIYLADSGK